MRAFIIVLSWRLLIAFFALPSLQLSYRDYIWLTMFFGISPQLYLALMFSCFGLIPGLLSANVFALVMYLTARFFRRDIHHPMRFLCLMGFAAIGGVTIVFPIGPALQPAYMTALEGAPAHTWLAVILEFALAIALSQFLARGYIRDMTARKPKQKPL